MARHVAGKLRDFPPGTPRAIQAGGKHLCVVNANGALHAVDELCPHRGGPLSEGTLEGTTLACPWHGAKFDILTGAVVAQPAPRGLKRYPVTVEGDDVVVDV